MSNNIHVEQNATLGANTTQIGQQNNYNGITVSEALDLVRTISEAQYLKVKPELLAALEEKFDQEFTKWFNEELAKQTATDEEVEVILDKIFGPQINVPKKSAQS